MAVTAKQVKELREMTGAGMMDCKKALTECDGTRDCEISEESRPNRRRRHCRILHPHGWENRRHG